MIFLSHTSKDEACTAQLAALLKEKGYEALFLDFDPDVGIAAGASWQATLYRKLRSCSALLALVTDDYLKSQWCFAEIALARMQGKHLYAILTAPLAADAKLPALLSDHQLVDGRGDFVAAVDRLVKALAAQGLSAARFRAWQPGRPPYPGFSAFEEADAAVYFGRDAEIERGVEMVRGSVRGTASRLNLLLGSSGSGKSSLLRAGIVPGLRREEGLVLVGPFRPGPEPLDELASQIANAFGVGEERLAALRNGQLDSVVRQLLRGHSAQGRHALLLIDQFEELLGRPPDHPSHVFLSLLQRSLQDPEGCVSVVATLRSDQLGQFQSHPAAQDIDWQTLFVGPLDAASLRSVIEEPARLAEIELESGLTEQMTADLTGPEALPLLALTLRRLWERGGGDGLLEIEEYRQLGGIQGAVARVADDALAGVSGDEQLKALQEALLQMVRLDDKGNAVRQPVRWEDTPAAARPLLDRFVKTRLLFRERDNLQVTHEALFTAWTRLRDWIAEHREALVVQQRVFQAARLWHDSQDDGDLWRGARLDRALELQVSGELVLGAAEIEFLGASRSAQQTIQEEKARREQERERLSRTALGRGLAYQALAEAQDRPQRGLLLAVEAVRTTSESGLGVTAAAENALRELLTRFGGECLASCGARVMALAFDPGGRRLAVGCEDGTVAVIAIDGTAGVERWRAREGESAILGLALGSRRLAARSNDGVVRIWDFDGDRGSNPRELGRPVPEKAVTAISDDGCLAAIAVEGEDLVVHDVDHGRRHVLQPATRITSLAFSPNNRWLAAGHEDGILMLWEVATLADGPLAMEIEGHEGEVWRIAWASQADCLVTCGPGNKLRRWEFGKNPGEVQLTEMPSSGSPILDLAVSAQGDLVVAGTWHSETLCWFADDTFSQPAVLKGHSSSIDSVAIRSDGEWLLTASSRDNFALLWPVAQLRDNPPPYALRGEDGWLEVVGFTPGDSLVAGSWAGSVRCWKHISEEPREMGIPGVDLNRWVVSTDGLLVSAAATMGVGGPIDPRGKLVNLNTGRVEPIEDPPTAVAVAMNPDGRLLAIASGQGVIDVRDRIRGTSRKLTVAVDAWHSSLTLDLAGRWLLAAGQHGATLFDLSVAAADVGVGLVRDPIAHAAFDESGERLLIAHQGQVTVWIREDGKFAPGPSVRHDDVQWCAFLKGGGWVSGSPERLQVTDQSRGWTSVSVPFGWEGSRTYALSAGADRVAVANNSGVASWDLGCADPLASRIDLPRHEGYIQSVAVSEDGARIATSMVDGPVRLWRAAAPGDAVSLPQTTRSAMLLAFIDHDRKLLTGDQFRSVAVWDLDIGHMVDRARRVAGREITAEERSRFLSV